MSKKIKCEMRVRGAPCYYITKDGLCGNEEFDMKKHVVDSECTLFIMPNIVTKGDKYDCTYCKASNCVGLYQYSLTKEDDDKLMTLEFICGKCRRVEKYIHHYYGIDPIPEEDDEDDD